jgi:hypothetical protein
VELGQALRQPRSHSTALLYGNNINTSAITPTSNAIAMHFLPKLGSSFFRWVQSNAVLYSALHYITWHTTTLHYPIALHALMRTLKQCRLNNKRPELKLHAIGLEATSQKYTEETPQEAYINWKLVMILMMWQYHLN